MFDRKIIYLHRYEREMDKGNVGYIKQENRNGTCTFSVALMNLPPNYEVSTKLEIVPMGFVLCKVNIHGGKGQGMAICEYKQLAEDGVVYEDIDKYQIRLSEETIIKGEIVPLKKEREEVVPQQKKNQEAVVMHQPEDKKMDTLVYKDKWAQISTGRKKVNLMGKESDYIEITPSDMIALSNPYHGLINNAFLQHGYRNYQHLILGPATKGNKSYYFIGVPGNFYKQEVNAARMFGFEYFENGAEKVQVGDFGYYMKKVRL